MPHYSQLEQALIGLRGGITMLTLKCSSETIEMNSTTWTSGTKLKWFQIKTPPRISCKSKHMCKMASSSYWDWMWIGIMRSQSQSQSQRSHPMSLKNRLASIMTCQLHKMELSTLQLRKLPAQLWHRFVIIWKALPRTQPIIIHNEIK